MNQIESTEGKILFLIYQLYNSNQISEYQKGELKDYLISKTNHRFMSAVSSYKKSNNTDQFVRFLIDYVSKDQSFVDALSINSSMSIKSQQVVNYPLFSRQASLSTDINQDFHGSQQCMLSPNSERRLDRDSMTLRRNGKKHNTQIF